MSLHIARWVADAGGCVSLICWQAVELLPAEPAALPAEPPDCVPEPAPPDAPLPAEPDMLLLPALPPSPAAPALPSGVLPSSEPQAGIPRVARSAALTSPPERRREEFKLRAMLPRRGRCPC